MDKVDDDGGGDDGDGGDDDGDEIGLARRIGFLNLIKLLKRQQILLQD